MVYKKYSFIKILADYNRKCERNFRLSPDIRSATLVHSLDTDSFNVTFIYLDNSICGEPRKASLERFIKSWVSSGISIPAFKGFIRSKEKDKMDLHIEIWPSSKIRYAYLCTNYFSTAGQLGKSCMRVKDMQKALNFYVKNNVRVVVIIDSNNKIHARALLWDGVKSTNRKTPFTYLDRVYAVSESLTYWFDKLREENKWKYYPSTSAGEAEKGYYIENIDISGICHLPYTDTFRHLYYKDNVLASSSFNPTNRPDTIKYKHDILHLTNTTEGGYCPILDPDRIKEAITGNYISKKDAIKIKRYNGYVQKKNIVSINGDYYSVHDKLIILTEFDSYILKENVVEEAITNHKIDKTKAFYSSKYNGYIHKSNIVVINDEEYHKKDSNITCFNNEWFHISQCFINYDRTQRNEEIERPLFTANSNFEPYKKVTSKADLIPKKYAIIAYDIVYNSIIDEMEYQEVYCTSNKHLIQLNTGEFIVDLSRNRHYLKKFNNKYYIKQKFELQDKNQLLLFK